MAEQASRHVFEQLTRRLAEVTEALFERAPYCRGRFSGAGARLSSLCRGPAKGDAALQVFEQRWPFLSADAQRSLREEWEIGLMRLLHEVKEPCGSCNPGFSAHVFMECSVCGLKVATLSEEMEQFAERFGDKLGVDTPPAVSVQQVRTQDEEERIRELEHECASYRETLGELQGALENTSNDKAAQDLELEELGKAKQELQEASRLLGRELEQAIAHIEKLAKDLDLSMRWQTAQAAYAALHLHTLSKLNRLEAVATAGEKTALELKALGFKHKQVAALMKLGRCAEAESMAKGVWDRRSELLPENAKEIRTISTDYCDILRRNGKHAEAERQYGLMWYTAMSRVLDPEEEEWKLETASRIGDVLGQQGRYSEAALWHRRVLEQRLGRSSLDIEKAAAAAAQCISCQRRQDHGHGVITDSALFDDLRRIWNERVPDSENADVLLCGHEVGLRLQTLAKDEEAAAILTLVWEKRRALGSRGLADCMDTALALADLSVKTENLSRLESLYHWITTNPIPSQDEGEQLWYRYRLACVQAALEKGVVAESNLRRVSERRKQLFGADDADTLQFTQVLAEVLQRQGKVNEAKDLAKTAWDARDRHPRSVLQAVLRTGHLYGDIIMESNSPDELARAEGVLREVWELATANISGNMTLSSLVSAGDCYGICLMKRRKFSKAKPVLAQAAEWKRWLSFPQADIDRSTHLHNRSVERAAKKHPSVYRPHRFCHPLRLRDYLDRWYSSTAAVQRITDS